MSSKPNRLNFSTALQQKLINELSPDKAAIAINLEGLHGLGAFVFVFTTTTTIFKACVHYFSIFYEK